MIRKLVFTILLSLLSIATMDAAEYGPVAAKESLWSIASRNRPSYDITTQQMMLAIRLANPDAFQTGNINSLKAGAILRLPTVSEIQRFSQSKALRAAKDHNILWQREHRSGVGTHKRSKGSTTRRNKVRRVHPTSSSRVSSYKRHYKASQRELRKLQKRLKREQRKVRHLKRELAAALQANDQQKMSSGSKGNVAVLQEELKKLEKVIEEKNVHISHLENMKAVASETIKRQRIENETLFNKLKAVAPDQVLNIKATKGSLKLEGVRQPNITLPTTQVPIAEQQGALTASVAKAKTNNTETQVHKGNGFIIALGVLSLLFAMALLWRLYSQYTVRKHVSIADKEISKEGSQSSEDSQGDSLYRKDPVLST